MSSFNSIGSGEVVVFTRIDDNASETIDNARHILVNQSALHVDVAEKNAIQSIVQHDIEAFESTHDGDFRHAKT